VRDGERYIAEEGAVFVPSDEFEGFGGDAVVRIDLLSAEFVFGDSFDLAVPPEVVRVKSMCLSLANVAVEVVKALFLRVSGGVDDAKAPFAECAGGIAGVLENTCDCLGAFFQRPLACNRGAEDPSCVTSNLYVVANLGAAAVQARHEDATGWGTDGVSAVVLSEFHSFGGEAVNIGGLDFFLAVAAQVRVAEIVGDDVDDVGLSGGSCAGEAVWN